MTNEGVSHNGLAPHDPQRSRSQSTEPWPIDSDLPPLSDDDQIALASLLQRQSALIDLTRGCIDGHHTGVYISGPAGVGKSHTVENTLRDQNANYRVYQRITAKPLYLEMERHPDAVIVIDDCEQLFSEKSALTLLRSALDGRRVNGRRERRVTYSVTGGKARVMQTFFRGSMIFLGNRALGEEKPEVAAVMSRIVCCGYAPIDNEIRALMRQVARRGHVTEGGLAMSSSECVEVIEYIIEIASERQCHLDLRWISHAYGHYLTQVASGGVNDWRDMVKFHVMHTVNDCDHKSSRRNDSGASDASFEQLQNEFDIAIEIDEMQDLSRTEKLKLWEQRTVSGERPKGLSRPTYYRRLKEGRVAMA